MKTTKYREFDRIERLKRRAEWLRKRVNKISPQAEYDRGELSALEWAIPLLEDHIINKTIQSMSPEARKAFGFEL